jgi:enolase-phosphatase E1
MKDVKYVLMDIEGTTTSVSFVYDVLFPYFQKNIHLLARLKNVKQVKRAFDEVKEIVQNEEGKTLNSEEEIIQVLLDWSKQDRKITALKTVQGILWETAYKTGEIVGHVYPDVPSKLMDWKKMGLKLGIFSSGSIAAQRLLFGYSSTGDLNRYFESNFDTTTGSKRDVETYRNIAKKVNFKPNQILFLSDIVEELQAANEAGYKTIQLVREGTVAGWPETAEDFYEIILE